MYTRPPIPTRTDTLFLSTTLLRTDYRPADVDRLRFVSRGRDLGFSLPEIRSLLRLAENEALSCQEVDQLARGHLKDIRTRLDDLQRMASELERVIHSCDGGECGQCTILATLRHAPASDP